MVIARKLDIPTFASWVSNELNGYDQPDDIPPYRSIRTILEAQDRWGHWLPVVFKQSKLLDLITTVPLLDSTAHIEELLRLSNKATARGRIQFEFAPEQTDLIMTQFTRGMLPRRSAQHHDLKAILEIVKTRLLDWSLKLEKDGVFGEGMTFSREEKDRAATVQNTTFNIGSMTQSQIQTESPQSSATMTFKTSFADESDQVTRLILDNEAGLGPDIMKRLNHPLTALGNAAKAETPNPKKIHEAIGSIRATLEGAAGNLIASGLLYEIGKLFT